MSNTYHSSLITHHFQRGQVLIITLLVMAVSLTIGLAISSRTITTLRQISYSAQSAQALSFAEAGIEHTLNCLKDETCGAGDSGSLDVNTDGTNDCDYSITVLPERSVFTELSPIARDKVIQLDLKDYSKDAGINIYWVDTAKPEEDAHCAAMEVGIVYLEGGEYKIWRGAWDCTTRTPPNNFTSAGAVGYVVDGMSYQYQAVVPALTALPGVGAGATPQLLRLRALYNCYKSDGETIEVPNSVAVEAAVGNLPSQGVKIESTGSVGRIMRKIRVIRSKTAALSEIFDYVLFSGSEDPADALTK